MSGVVLKELQFYIFRWSVNFRNQKALYWHFIIESFTIVMNNLAFYFIWMMFSYTVGAIHGWGMAHIMGAISAGLLTIGIMDTLCGSMPSLQNMVPSGGFDALMSRPKNLYLQILNQDFRPSAIGDLLQGAIGVGIFCYWVDAGWSDVLCILIMLIPAVIAMISFIFTTDCVIFWLPQAKIIVSTLGDMMYLPLTQPISLLRGKMRAFYMTVVPVLLVGGLPIEVVTYHTYQLIAVSYAIALSWLFFSIWILRCAVRRYESGNGVGG